ncbi:MAG: dienelactone hydrolase [Betaproteobacteria bacterium]|nr:dienelactone hydrolase [Betaproteobacteria bacterium]
MMKRAASLLWRYLLIVASSCLLALFISQSQAHAAEKDYAKAGPLAVEVVDAVWRDEKRERDIPVRIHVPQKQAQGQTYPVILFSHGLGGSVAGGKLWGEHWASYGYIVLHMQHAGSDEALWKGKAPRDIAPSMKAGMTLGNLANRVQDVRFVIDEIARRAKAKEAPFAAADLSRLGMSGHSFGAQTTLAVSGQASSTLGGQSGLEPRIQAAIAFSPNARNKARLDKQFGDIRIPFFSITGTADGSVLDDNTQAQDRTLPYQHMMPGEKYLAVFAEGDHMVFGGHTLAGRRRESERDREIQTGVKAATLAFWNSTLKGDAEARKWLQQGGFQAMLKSDDRFEWK